MEEIFMTNQLMTWLSNTMKSEKYQQGRVIISWTGCSRDYVYFKNGFWLITADLIKQKALDPDPKAIQQVIFTGKLDDEVLTVFYILEKSKETILKFSKGTTKVL